MATVQTILVLDGMRPVALDIDACLGLSFTYPLLVNAQEELGIHVYSDKLYDTQFRFHLRDLLRHDLTYRAYRRQLSHWVGLQFVQTAIHDPLEVVATTIPNLLEQHFAQYFLPVWALYATPARTQHAA